MRNVPAEDDPAGALPASGAYWFTPMPVYLVEAVFHPDSPVNASAAMLWAHIHRHYAWRRRVFPSYAKLAEETGQSESAVKRQMNALKQAGALTWGATYGPNGRSSNEYAMAPMKAFDFDRTTSAPVQVKNDLHPGVKVKSDPHRQVKNDLGVKNTEEVRASLSPRLPRQTQPKPAAAPVERETTATPNNTPALQVAAAWQAARGGRRNPAAERDITTSAAELLAADWPLADVIALAQDMATKYPTGRNLSKHAHHWQPPTLTAVPATNATGLPAPCERCESENPAARFNPRLRTTPNGKPCPDCHPDATPLAA